MTCWTKAYLKITIIWDVSKRLYSMPYWENFDRKHVIVQAFWSLWTIKMTNSLTIWKSMKFMQNRSSECKTLPGINTGCIVKQNCWRFLEYLFSVHRNFNTLQLIYYFRLKTSCSVSMWTISIHENYTWSDNFPFLKKYLGSFIYSVN